MHEVDTSTVRMIWNRTGAGATIHDLCDELDAARVARDGAYNECASEQAHWTRKAEGERDQWKERHKCVDGYYRYQLGRIERLREQRDKAEAEVARLTEACRDGNRGCCVDGTCCACCSRVEVAEAALANRTAECDTFKKAHSRAVSGEHDWMMRCRAVETDRDEWHAIAEHRLAMYRVALGYVAQIDAESTGSALCGDTCSERNGCPCDEALAPTEGDQAAADPAPVEVAYSCCEHCYAAVRHDHWEACENCPSSPWCRDCPDHEACSQGAPCELVKRVAAWVDEYRASIICGDPS